MRRKILAVMFSVVCLIGFQATGPTISPSAVEEKQRGQGPPKESKKVVDNEKGITPPARMDEPSTLAEPEQKQQPDRKRGNATPPDNSTRVTDWLVAVFTGILTILAGLQWLTMKQQAELARDALRETRIAAQAAATSAKAAIEAVSVARQEFVAAQRPRLVVRGESTDDWDLFTGTGEERARAFEARLLKNCPAKVSGLFRVANTGGTTATISSYYAELIVGSSLGMVPLETSSETINHNSARLLPGQSDLFYFPTGEDFVVSASDAQYIAAGKDGYLYLIGWVEYVDDSGNRRRTAFCRRWNSGTYRFQRVADEDYEYAD